MCYETNTSVCQCGLTDAMALRFHVLRETISDISMAGCCMNFIFVPVQRERDVSHLGGAEGDGGGTGVDVLQWISLVYG
jgi:hypothetical protein